MIGTESLIYNLVKVSVNVGQVLIQITVISDWILFLIVVYILFYQMKIFKQLEEIQKSLPKPEEIKIDTDSNV